MTHADKTTTCDAEVGHYTRGWHCCNGRAVITVERRAIPGLRLDFCKRHATKERTSSANLNVREL